VAGARRVPPISRSDAELAAIVPLFTNLTALRPPLWTGFMKFRTPVLVKLVTPEMLPPVKLKVPALPIGPLAFRPLHC
jgi:hypothetical protein